MKMKATLNLWSEVTYCMNRRAMKVFPKSTACSLPWTNLALINHSIPSDAMKQSGYFYNDDMLRKAEEMKKENLVYPL